MPPWRPPAEPVGGGRPRWRVNGSGDGPLLVGAAVAGPQFELGAVGGVGSGVVEALAGGGVDELPVFGLPLLVGAAGALPQLDQGAVGGAGAGDVHALAVNLQRAVGLDGPGLVGAAVAVPHLDLGTVGGGLTVVVDALGAVVASRDRAGHPATAGAANRGDRQVVELVGLVAGGAETDVARGVGGVVDGYDVGAVDRGGNRRAVEGQRQVLPGARAGCGHGAAGQRGRAPAAIVADHLPGAGVGLLQVVLVGRRRVVADRGAGPPDEPHRTSLLDQRVRGHGVVGPARTPADRERAGVAVPFDGLDRCLLLEALAGPAARARLDLERALHLRQVRRLLAGGVGIKVVGVRQGQRALGGGNRGALALPGGGGQRVHVAGLQRQGEAAVDRGDVLRVHEPGRRVGGADAGGPHVHRPRGKPASDRVVHRLGRGRLRRLDDRAPVGSVGGLQRDVAAVTPAAADVPAGGVDVGPARGGELG